MVAAGGASMNTQTSSSNNYYEQQTCGDTDETRKESPSTVHHKPKIAEAKDDYQTLQGSPSVPLLSIQASTTFRRDSFLA